LMTERAKDTSLALWGFTCLPNHAHTVTLKALPNQTHTVMHTLWHLRACLIMHTLWCTLCDTWGPAWSYAYCACWHTHCEAWRPAWSHTSWHTYCDIWRQTILRIEGLPNHTHTVMRKGLPDHAHADVWRKVCSWSPVMFDMQKLKKNSSAHKCFYPLWRAESN
jgi:hypothetical protein